MKRKNSYFFLLTIISIIFIFCNNCDSNEVEKEDNVFIEITSYHPCELPYPSVFFQRDTLVQFYIPEFLKNCLETVIEEEKKCLCYNEKYTGFRLEFSLFDNGTKIRITSINNIAIADYSDCIGFFHHNNFFFAIYGDTTNLSLKKNNEMEFTTFFPKQFIPTIDDSKSFWIYYYQDSISLINHHPCIIHL